MNAIQSVLDEEQKPQFQPTPAEVRKGHAIFHHSLTIHGSYANRSDRPRRGLVINVIRDGVISDSDESLLKGVPPIPKGQKVEGRFFPLLYEGGSVTQKSTLVAMESADTRQAWSRQRPAV